ncbi:MAG: hypothetical protein EA422_15470 [Gemmatimonadales bacterium]|nr:MAG: hypothetical protein EA422_15470 [Gemmatimonadales bacterium]
MGRFTDATASLSATRLAQDRKTPSRWSLYFFNSLLGIHLWAWTRHNRYREDAAVVIRYMKGIPTPLSREELEESCQLSSVKGGPQAPPVKAVQQFIS